MKGLLFLKSALAGGASVLTLVHSAAAKEFDVPDGDLSVALVAYMKQSDVEIIYADGVVRGHRTGGAKGDYTETAALTQILRGTGFTTQTMPSNAVEIVPQPAPVRVAQAAKKAIAPSAASDVETVVVTAQKKNEDIQQVPIAITALSQQQLTERQIAGGPDLIKDVPNLTFSKTNFSGYDLEIRGIGTQAISVTTDPAVAVAFNGTPFIRNHFFEQEFYDLQDVEVLRGPQGTLYGRNATAGVVNIKSALPTDQYEAMLSADLGNYSNRRLEAMLNLPIAGDFLDVRVAGEWTRRDGYTDDTTLNMPVDGRDLWSGRVTIGFKPSENFRAELVWEHFSEDDDRLRSGKQLCKTDPLPTSIEGVPVPAGGGSAQAGSDLGGYFSQGCLPASLYSAQSFEVPNGFALPYIAAAEFLRGINDGVDPYASTTQSTNLRQIQSVLLPHYRAKNDVVELNVDYSVTPAFTLTSQTGYGQDYLYSTEDYNRFDTAPGIFGPPYTNGVYCDPQLGCSDRIVAQDLSDEHAWQLSQELRLTSNFSGPLNFSMGGNFLLYKTEENYYVFINANSLSARIGGGNCNLTPQYLGSFDSGGGGYQYHDPTRQFGGVPTDSDCIYVDPNSLSQINNQGHNYFLSQNPYSLNSYAAFGEANYNLLSNLKLTTGLRWTDDQKHFTEIPSEVLAAGYGYGSTGVEDQQWDQVTGRAVINWTPQLDFTDQTLIYGSYSHGYKAGGANPPGAVLIGFEAGDTSNPIHPLTFKPEFVEAFEVGSKNTLLDGALTLNADIFYYNYHNYQISEIVDRTSINQNFNAHVTGAEVEGTWQPVPGLRFNFAGGWENTALASGDSAVDLIDRTDSANHPGWMVVKPFIGQASNCILPTDVVAASLKYGVTNGANASTGSIVQVCGAAYGAQHLDPVTDLPYTPNPTIECTNLTAASNGLTQCSQTGLIPGPYAGFDPSTAPNNGQGFSKNLSGHKLPNAPPFTLSLGGEYSMPVSDGWLATARADFYWQADSWARVFNDNPYDRLRGYSDVNLALIFTNQSGWQVMAYVKNVFDVTAITGDFLNSDDSGLTTNVFLTDPRLIGIRVTKQLDQNDGFWGSDYSGFDFFTDLFADKDGGKPPLWIELGGQAEHIQGLGAGFSPAFLSANPTSPVIWRGTTPIQAQEPPLLSFGEEASVSFQPEGSDWIVSASIRYGRSNRDRHIHHQSFAPIDPPITLTTFAGGHEQLRNYEANYADTVVKRDDSHTIVDFNAGKDVGLGAFGILDTSTLSAGLRFAEFSSNTSTVMRARPEVKAPGFFQRTFHQYYLDGAAKRSFHGVGPSLSWKASTVLAGDADTTEAALDFGANAAVLFGRQRTRVNHLTTGLYHHKYNFHITYPQTFSENVQRASDRSIVTPNFGGFAAISVRRSNATVSFGYRADLFFGAIDGGIDKRKSETLNMGGPFVTISFGLGG